MDVQDDYFHFRTVLVDKSSASFGYAVLIFGADCIITNPTRHIILGIYVVVYVIQNIKKDMRLSIIRGLSLILFWFCFYSWDFSLLSIYGVFMITKMALMTFGNASLWVVLPGVIFDTYSIAVGNVELATYAVTWLLLSLISRLAKLCLSPFRGLSPFLQALVATAVVQLIVFLLATGAASRMLQDLQRRFFQRQQNVIISKTSTVPTSPYTYARRLTSGMEIRLLKLYPRANDEEVRCEIVYHPLEKLLDYEAISYTWGDIAEKADIVVDDQAFETSAKVSEMLRSLRNTWKPRMLWIDFICINQNDTDEKSHQVQLMRHIYHRAITVITWLDPLPDTPQAVDLLVEIVRRTQLEGLTGPEGLHVYGQRSQRSRVLSLARFLANDYFNRLWVVQEIASARKVKVFCGNQAIEWDDLGLLLRFVGNPEMHRSLQSTEEMDIISCNQDSICHGQTINHTKAYMAAGISYSLAYTLSSFRSFKCKDPRDKVFALLGLIRGADHPLILPDYNKDEVQVYKDVAQYIFTVEQTSRKLLALAVAGIGNYRRLRELPSWVPDWASNMRRKDVEDEEKGSTDHVPTSKQNTFSFFVQTISNYGNSNDIMRSDQSHFEASTIGLGYRAALGTDPQIELVENDILGIRGFLVDEIDSLTSILELPFSEDMKISHTEMTLAHVAWFEEVEALAARAPLPYPTGENVEDIVWRTMTGDRLLENEDRNFVRPAPREYVSIYRELKAATSRLQEACDLLGAQAVIEVRDIMLELLVHTAGGRSAFELWMQVLCGRSGHPEVWKLITAGTKFADGDGPLPDFPEVSGDALFWSTQFFEFFENDDTKVIGERFLRLIQIFSPPSSYGGFDELQTDTPQRPFELSQQNAPQYAQMVSRFSEGLRMSFERRMCLTKKGYIGLVPPLTRVGDRVCILFGGDAPYLIRPEKGRKIEESTDSLRCQLVGECYMHGMMDGEMMHLAGKEFWFQLI
ncbi:heterokaryon incompatibility protein-domain-containing protein [Biscogniauxia marginata]|nr:heterokaryon incompatibility protein-domain-containing protein [Biscogniauxia marginata]